MKRYFLIFFLIFSDTIYAQKSLFKKHNLTLNVVNKIDFNQNFNLTDNKVAELFKDALLKKNVNVSGVDNRYFVSISYGWKYKRSTELEIDNYTGFIIDVKNGDKVLAEFSSSKTKNLEESIDALVSKLFYENERIYEEAVPNQYNINKINIIDFFIHMIINYIHIIVIVNEI